MTPKLLRPVWGLQRLPLLLWLAGQGTITRADAAREFPAIRPDEIGNALEAFTTAGWLTADRLAQTFTFNLAAVHQLESALDTLLQGDWPAAELDEDALRGEISLWRSGNRLAVLQAVRNGRETRPAIQAATGLPANSVSTAVLELLERGHLVERTWAPWGEDVPLDHFVPQRRASQLRLLVKTLHEKVPA